MENIVKPLRGNKAISWILRMILLLVAIFFLLFSFDVFGEPNRSTGDILLGFLIHNIPVIFLLLTLWVAWKWEHIGGFALICIGIAMVFFFGGPLHIMCHTWVMISLPVIVGLLFLCNYYLIKPKK